MSKDTSIAGIKKDNTDGKYVNGSTYTYLSESSATQETASLFVLGMGLHSLQGIQAHGMQATPHNPTDHNDDVKWDYNEKTGWTQGMIRIKKTETDTKTNIDTFLYGDGTDNNPGYGNYLFTPYVPPKSKK